MSNIIQTFPKGSGGGHVVLDTNGTAVDQEKKLQFTGLDVSDDSTNEKTEVKAVGLNADSLDDIIQSASVQGNAVAGNGLVYSTTEQVVGKWIDGKPIYQKTFIINSIHDGDVITTGVDTLVNNVWCGLNDGGTQMNSITIYNGNFQTGFFVARNSNNEIKIFDRGNTLLSSVIVTLQYTKTTD